MHLSDCPLDRDVVILSVDLASESRTRMHEIGLHTGAVVHVTHRGPSGGRVIAVGGARLALDGSTAAAVAVEEL